MKTIFTKTAEKLESAELETLARFRAAAQTFTWLPAGDLNQLPSGFLQNRFKDGKLTAQLNPFGMRVAMAAEALTKEVTVAA